MQAIRNIIKYLAALVLYYSGALALFDWLSRKFGARSNYIILMYHRVLEDINAENVFTQPGMSVSSEAFDHQLEYLKSKYRVIDLEQLVQTFSDDRRASRPMAVITFDDGWRDNYSNAFPLLKKHNLPARIFVTTDYINTNRPFWFLMVKWILTESQMTADMLTGVVADLAEDFPSESEDLAELVHVIKTAGVDSDKIIQACKKLEHATLERLIEQMLARTRLSPDYWERDRPMLTWEQARCMSRQGIGIESHGCSHRILTLLPSAEICREITASKTAIESELGGTVSCFAYPNGNYDEEVKSAVEQAGYSCAVTTAGEKKNSGKSDKYALRRVAVHDGVSAPPLGRFSKAMFAWHLIRHA
ncbi:MAG: polysaccharide deacetylase family protein [Candidatus Zixiibacteriota bacterium]|nr:MAG: polysaccharide deacetylase family protein [candidate division Zixibacteria bacterium]